MRRVHAAAAVTGIWLALGAPIDAQAQRAGDATGKVQTVLGPIDPAQLGHTLMHEHVLADFSLPETEPDRWKAAGRTRPIGATAVRLYNAPLTIDILSDVMLGAPNRENQLLDAEATAVAELAEFKRRGGTALVDVTSIGLRRNPAGLQRVARATGVQLVMGTGWYQAGWWPTGLGDRSIESLVDEMVRDITVGVEGTDVRAGIIGEVGIAGGADSAAADRVLRAVGRASRETGAAVLLSGSAGFRQHGRVLDVLQSEGADLRRAVLGHGDAYAGDLAYLRPLLDRGATIAFDMLGTPPLVTRTWPIDSEVARTIVELVKAGYADRIVVSQGIEARTNLKAYGGTGYSFIAESFLPYLKRQGLTDAQLNTIVVENPRRLLTLVAPQASRSGRAGGE
ncbi:MAG: phosphotriesterase [Gemmatimonadaceae bacterium]|nr:phosphotriesterase [Gemmatimonadaceae bacterium]